MHEEIDKTISISVNLSIVATVVFMIVITIGIGKLILNNSTDAIHRVRDTAADEEVIDITLYNKPLPAPSLFLFLMKNETVVRSVEGDAYGVKISSIEDLKQLFNKKLSYSFVKEAEKYKVIIGEEGV